VLNLPAYDYACFICDLFTEVNHGFDDRPVVPCMMCNRPMAKKINRAAVHFKGKGWGKDA
jgi:putative FmdB family regulatory protein